MSRILAIAMRNRPRQPMQLVDSAQISVHSGILGDYRGAQKGRQVTILSESAWRKACRDVGSELPWTLRRANLLIDGIEFDDGWVGASIRIGSVELVVSAETIPCSRMDEQQPGLTAALAPEWRGGICCDVLQPGHIQIGDQIELA